MFSVAGDGGDTQVLDAGPAASDGKTDCGCGGDDEIPILYGETQALDDVDCEDDGGRDGGIKGCGETQLVDTSAGEPSERTEVLSEEEGPSSIAGTTCDASSGGRGRVEERADGGHHWALEEEEEEDSCDSDASTDDEDGDAGSRRRSFADIRAKAVRSSGLAASRHLASKKLDGDHSKKAGNYETGGTYIRGFGINNRAENRENVTNLYSQIGELHLEHGIDNSFWSLKDYYKQGDKDNRSRNRRARKLFDETYFEEDKSRGKAEDNAEPKGISHLLATDNFAGLSYVVSQEPGDQSQANALDVVDKFLLTNDAGSSQEFKNGLSDIVKCAPVSCMKIFEHLAEKTDRRNSIGTPSIYDWDDNLEDEGGGDFFCKRKDSFFKGTTVARKTKCQHAKIRPSITNRSRGVFENSDTVKGENKINCNKATALAHSDSRLVMRNSIKNTELHISQTQTRKNLFNPLNEESNPKALDDNLHVTDAECLEGVYNCGSDTQMADETMEALYVASPVKPDKEDRHLTPGISVQKTNSIVKKRAPQKNALLQMRTSLADPFDAEGTITRSMRKRIQATKERRESSVLDRDLSINSRMKKSQGHRFSQMKMRLEKLKLGQLTGESSERRAALESVKRKKGEGRLDKTSYKNIDVFVDQQNGDSSFSEELKNRVQDDDSAPVAHRTRHSKRAKLLEDAEKLTNVNEPDGNGLRDMQKEVKFIADASAPQVTRTVSANIGPQLGVEVRKCSSNYSGMPISGTALEGSSVSYLEDTMITQPTDKRTTEHTLGNQILDNGNRPAVSIDNRAKTDKHAKNEERKKVYIRSVSEILLKAKQHRRIDSTQMLLEYNALLSNSKLAPGVALRTRSLQKSPLEINKYLSRSVSNQAGPVEPVTPCSNSLNDHVIDSEKLTTHNSGEDTEHAEENAHLKGLSRGRIQSPSLACATPSKRKNVLSPICVAEDLPKSPKRVSATPVARELLILESSEASTTSAHQDVRRRKYMTSVRVLFSNHLGEDMVKQQKKILTRLGLAVASSIVDATHFVTDKFVRTQNMLEAIAAGKPVVTPMWLESCGQASCSLDERNYILRDTKKEKEIGFNMQVSLARACQCPILLGKTVYMTPNVKPSRQVLSSVVKAANGQAIARIGRSITKQDGVPANLLIISCLEDYSLCIPLLEKGAQIFSPELLLNGIVIQKLEYSRHELFIDHVKRTRSTIWLKDKVGQFLPVNRCI